MANYLESLLLSGEVLLEVCGLVKMPESWSQLIVYYQQMIYPCESAICGMTKCNMLEAPHLKHSGSVVSS